MADLSVVVSSQQRNSDQQLGTNVTSQFLSTTHVRIIDRIQSERMSLLPVEGSVYDKVLAWAQLFVERIGQFHLNIERFVDKSYLATQISYEHCALLLELGRDNADALMVPFSFFHSISMPLVSLLERTELFSASQDIQEQLPFALFDLVTVVASVATHFHKAISEMTGASLSVNIYRTFFAQIQTFSQRCERIAESMWRHQFLREKLDGEQLSELKAIRSWLGPADPAVTALEDSRSIPAYDREELTCLWMSGYLSRFLKGWKKHLSITGTPGSGKTVLASVIADHLQYRHGRVSYQTLFISITAGIPDQTSSHAVAKNILYQLLDGRIGNVGLFRILRDAFHSTRVATDQEEHDKILWTAVEQSLGAGLSGSREVVVVVDGVDEASSREEKLLEQLRTATFKAVNTKLITLSSNGTPTAAEQVQVRIEDDFILDDIAAVVRGGFNHHPAFSQLPEIEQEVIVDRVAQASKGSFLWAKLTTTRIRKQQDIDGLLKSADSLVSGQTTITGHVRHILRASDVTREAKLMLLWLCTASRPLHLKELSALASIDTSKQTVGLSDTQLSPLEVLKPLKALVFLHNDYLYLRHGLLRTATLDIWAKGNLIPNVKDRHHDIMARLLTYIKATVTVAHEVSVVPHLSQHDCNTFLGRYPLLDFALRYWVLHFRETSAYTQEGDIAATKELGDFLPSLTTVVLLQGSVWENVSPPELLAYRISTTAAYRQVLTAESPATLQSIICLAHIYRQLGRITDATPLFHEATILSQKILTSGHIVTMQLARVFLEITTEQITSSKTSIMVQREEVLSVLVEHFNINYSNNSEEIISVLTQLMEHHEQVKDNQKAQSTLVTIQSLRSSAYGETSNEASDSLGVHPVGVGDDSTYVQSEIPTDSGYASAVQPKIEQARTVYSDASSLSAFHKESYISEFAEDLFVKVFSSQPDAHSSERISEVLPDLLKAFALKVGHNAPSQMHRDVMYFIHKNRSNITDCFNENGFHQDESLAPGPESMPLNELMSLWDQNLEEAEDDSIPEHEPDTSSLSDWDQDSTPEDVLQINGNIDEPCVSDSTSQHSGLGAEDNIEEGTSASPFLAYKDFISKSPAYEWLLATLRRELILAPAEPSIMEEIRTKIVMCLPSSNRISRRTVAEAYRVALEIDWNPLAFAKEQAYKEEPGEVVETAITLTGSAKDAQALPCAQYLLQTWPTTGRYIIQLVKDVVGVGPGNQKTCVLPDNTEVTAWVAESAFHVKTFGTADSVAEVGEQFAWLSAALRSSPHGAGVNYCVPVISYIGNNQHSLPASGMSSWPLVHFKIGFHFQENEEEFLPSNGQCWHNLFRNPVVVKGYPMLRRPEENTGLEIPLNMMAGLAQTKRINSFNQKLFIKGFSTMLVPTRRQGDTLLWHLIYNVDRSRISYLQNIVPHADKISIFDLEIARHIVGWCSESKYNAGGADADYLIGSSRLSRPHEGCMFKELQVFKGHVITGGFPFSIGHKDTPFHITRNGHIPRLKWIHTKFVVLWDEDDKRGWLVNGTSALLHVLRASLKHDSIDEINSEFLFKPEELQEAPESCRATSAIKVLANRNNMQLPIYREKEGYFRVEDRMEDLYDVLEKIMDYQVSIAAQSNPNLCRPRKYLEGWDFNDLATCRDIIYPRVATLKPVGKGWVDFTRAIHAITLFGRGFGEVIRPVSTGLCARWTKMPQGMYYLAACGYDLSRLMSMDGNPESNPLELTHNVLWHNPHKDFGTCQCIVDGQEKHSDFAQVLLPSAFSKSLTKSSPVPLNDGSAVIFGNNEAFKWYWKNTGHPEEGEPQSSSEESENEFHDSGIGSDLGSSSLMGRSSRSQNPSSGGTQTRTRELYTVGIICALQKELLAVRMLFDARHENLETALRDTNHYALGRIARHNIVAACLPSGEYGTNAAADVVSHMTRSFPAVQFCLLVGIGGGVPSRRNDIRLGDVVVSHPTDVHPGVIQYDLGRVLDRNQFVRTGSLQRPPRFLMTAISSLMSDPERSSTPIQRHIKDIIARNPEYQHPGMKYDKLFNAGYIHPPGAAAATCAWCSGPQVKRKSRTSSQTRIHYGLIASGNQVIKDAKTRDRLGGKYNILCFEMEAAGVMNVVPSLVIRGICDYADSHKNKTWQAYASAAAAAYTKTLLSVI